MFESLTKEADFKQIGISGKKWHGKYIKVASLTGREISRVGIVVSKKVSNRATDRNKIRRRLKEIIKSKLVGCSPLEIVVWALAEAMEATYEDLSDEVDKALKNTGGER